MIHRDVKPANILLAGEEGREHAYITDFGLAKHVASSSEQTSGGMVMGTLDYISPEQIEHRPVDARADIYALGGVLYKALTGSVPFPHEDGAAKIWAHVHEDPSPPSATAGVPASFDEVISRAMAKRPEDRYPSAGDFGRAAVAAASGAPVVEPERRVARGDALTPSLMKENEEGITGDLARRYSEVEPTTTLDDATPSTPGLPAGTAPPVRRRRRRRVPPALVAALIGAAVGGGIFLLERQNNAAPAAPSPAAAALIAQADDICAEKRGEFNVIVEGLPDKLAPSQLPTEAAALGRLVDVGHESLKELRALKPPPELQDLWKRYLRLRSHSVDAMIAARDAAAKSDVGAYDAAFKRINSPQLARKRHDVARAIGLQSCNRYSPKPHSKRKN